MKRVQISLLSIIALMLAGRFWQELPAGAAKQGAGAVATENGDTNGDGGRDISDAVYLLNWLFGGGPEPEAIAACPDLEARPAAVEECFAALKTALSVTPEGRVGIGTTEPKGSLDVYGDAWLGNAGPYAALQIAPGPDFSATPMALK